MNRFKIAKDLRTINTFAGILFVVIVATISHFLFSHLGFNPTDNGWLLAGSRRIIEGQIPHRDVISHMPTFSFFLHAPFVLFWGNYVFLSSRYFVWLQFASIAWVWTVMITRSFKVFLNVAEKFAVALISFVFSVHYFPIMAWFTVDGLFFVSLGILLCNNEPRWTKMIGYALVGLAPLCKQSFLPMIPIVLILFDDWRHLIFWIMASIPIATYGVYLAVFGALPDAILQLMTYSNFLSFGVTPYVNRVSVPLGIITGVIATYMTCGTFNFRHRSVIALLKIFGFLILFAIVFGAAWSLVKGGYTLDIYPDIFGYSLPLQVSPSFGIFGAAVGVNLFFLVKEQKMTNYLRIGVLVIFVAWCTSLSLGYRFPTLGTGPLVLFLITSGQFSFQLIGSRRVPNISKSAFTRWISFPKNLETVVNILVILSVASSLVAFGMARETNIYREQPASNLIYDLGDVLPGAKGIKTNKNTYDFLVDLQHAKNIVREKEKEYCIIPDMGANWVKDSQTNPLPTDSTSFVAPKKELLERIIGDLEEKRGAIIVIVQKYEASRLADGYIPLSDSHPIVNYVRSNFEKMGETPYFELYE